MYILTTYKCYFYPPFKLDYKFKVKNFNSLLYLVILNTVSRTSFYTKKEFNECLLNQKNQAPDSF